MLALIKLIGRPLFRVLFAVEYHGIENVPESGPVILAGNHPSFLDPLLIALPIKRVIRYMAWDALFRIPLLGMLIRALGAFPVDIRRGKGEAAYREALRVLEANDALGIFPEGQRSEGGPMGELKSGVARLALETGAAIVPITIGGASRAWPKYRLLPKPARIIVRYHAPIYLSADERAAHQEDRSFQREIIERVMTSINRSLVPALRGDAQFEKWYRQPPSHIRSYEWAPLVAAIIATLAAGLRGTLNQAWLYVWLPVVVYYLYLIADLTVIRPGREAKWLRNFMPVYFILTWHYSLIRALGIPAGEMNLLLACAALAAFFPYFWEDYYTLQKFVRGLVVVYYFSLALLLGWPHRLGVFIAILSFILIFSLWYKTNFHVATVVVMLLAITTAMFITRSFDLSLSAYVALAVAAVVYLQTFVNAAYDIRKAGEVSMKKTAHRS
ncbi:MAG: lysophospholipid acyltransferase family protein [Blastocatellia bacterium]